MSILVAAGRTICIARVYEWLPQKEYSYYHTVSIMKYIIKQQSLSHPQRRHVVMWSKSYGTHTKCERGPSPVFICGKLLWHNCRWSPRYWDCSSDWERGSDAGFFLGSSGTALWGVREARLGRGICWSEMPLPKSLSWSHRDVGAEVMWPRVRLLPD